MKSNVFEPWTKDVSKLNNQYCYGTYSQPQEPNGNENQVVVRIENGESFGDAKANFQEKNWCHGRRKSD